MVKPLIKLKNQSGLWVPCEQIGNIRLFRVNKTSGQNFRWSKIRSIYVVSQGVGPVVQYPISSNPGLTLNKTYRVNPGLVLIGL